MQTNSTETTWLGDGHEFSLTELSELSGLSESELRELVEYGAVKPVNPDAASWIFSGTCLSTVRTAYRLRVSFELELQGVALTVSLLERIHELELQLRSVQAQIPQPVR
jgi:chaperone modulatory protein CbpM